MCETREMVCVRCMTALELNMQKAVFGFEECIGLVFGFGECVGISVWVCKASIYGMRKVFLEGGKCLGISVWVCEASV